MATAAYPKQVSEGGSSPDEAAINLAGGFFEVSSKRVKWKRAGAPDRSASWQHFDLPADWKQLRLEQVGEGVVVIVDGQHVAVVRPDAV